MEGVKAIIPAAKEVLAAIQRRIWLFVARAWGSLSRWASRPGLLVIWYVAGVAVLLLVLPPLLNQLSLLLSELRIWKVLGIDKAPHAGQWWTPQRVLAGAAAFVVVRWFIRARERVVVEEFVDFTSRDAKAVKGLATLLVAELSRLRDLYGRVNDQLSVPTSVGVRRQGATLGTEAGAFLSVRADDISEALQGAVAAESKITVGGIAIPIGPVLALIGRIARGPRVVGSVHLTEAGGGPTITAQMIGRGPGYTWRVDSRGGDELLGTKAFLDPMVAEVACRMFTDLTLSGTVKWTAVEHFTEYLRLYWHSLHTPRDRAAQLKHAEGKLLEALAEDERFDLAYYNLGVIYSQLAQAEARAAEASEDLIETTGDPEQAHRARRDAAMTAFRKTVMINRDRWEAVYGLAVHSFTQLHRRTGQRRQRRRAADTLTLETVVRLCERVIELSAQSAQAYDLKGMAHLELGQARAAVRSHRRAVALSWKGLCRAERAARARPSQESGLSEARANAAAALHNLARAHTRVAADGHRIHRGQRLWQADWVFRQALKLTPPSSKAATEHARGLMRLQHNRASAARKCFGAATRVEPENPVYWANLALARAADGDAVRAKSAASQALNALAPIYRRSLERFPSPYVLECRDDTLTALARMCQYLDDRGWRQRVIRISTLHPRLTQAQCGAEIERVSVLRRMWREFGPERTPWEYEQVGLVLARALGERAEWKQGAEIYAALIEHGVRARPDAIRQHDLYAQLAKALRHADDQRAALEAAARGLLRNPLSAAVQREMGACHFALLQLAEAREAWRHALSLTPNDPFLHWRIGFCAWKIAQDRQDLLSHAAELAEAGRHFAQAALLFGVENANGWAWSELWLGRVRLAEYAYDDAIEHLRVALGFPVTTLAAHLFLGEAHRANGNFWISRHHVEKACSLAASERASQSSAPAVDHEWGETLTFDEVTSRAKCGLAYCLANCDDNPAGADAEIKAALEVAELIEDPRARAECTARCLDLEATLLFERGELEEALRRVQRAARLLPVADILLHLLRIYDAEQNPLSRRHVAASVKDGEEAIRRLAGNSEPAIEAAAIRRRFERSDDVAAGNGAETLG